MTDPDWLLVYLIVSATVTVAAAVAMVLLFW